MAPRILLCSLVLLALAGCGAEEEAGDGAAPGGPPPTELTVRLDPDGRGPEPARRAQISCAEASTEPVCAAAQELSPASFEPTPDDVACTELFGGPQTATISGTLDGVAVEGRFSRQNGCEIARWDEVAPLLQEARP